MTYKEALQSGYTNGDLMWQRKYVSRKVNAENQPVLVAGGSRSGQLYVELPAWNSTNYSFRQYLKKN